MSETITVGEAIARTLEQYQVSAVYGIISIHNLPIADAIGQRGQIRFVPARGEAGAVTMADAHSRFTGLGVALTSTGAGAGNAIGSMVEALNAGSPLLHITGQVEKAYLDQDTGFIHETRDQLGFLRAASKAAYRVYRAEQAIATLHKAIQQAQTAPYGPVAIEIPIDIQNSQIALSALTPPVNSSPNALFDKQGVEKLYQLLQTAQRPLLWVGAGAISAQSAIKRLADAGIAVISSTHARGVLADSHPRSLRALHNSASIAQLLQQTDLTIVAGSRLRSNETKTWSLPLAKPLVQIDIDPAAAHRNYPADLFIQGDCQQVLSLLAERYQTANKSIDSHWDQQIQQAVQQAEQEIREQIGPYSQLNDAIEQHLPADGIFVRDITVSASVWGSRLLTAQQPLHNIHSLAGAIGLGLSMAIGCAIANPQQKVLALVGDGGLMLGVGELATMAQEQLNLTLLIMNDGGYGVMRGIQKKYFQGRQYYNQLLTPSFCQLAQSMGIKHFFIEQACDFASLIAEAINYQGPSVVEVDMQKIGSIEFAGPPQKNLY